MAAVQRQPFAELGASRLQNLSSQKNFQNSITEVFSSKVDSSFKKPQIAPTVTKRPYTPPDDNDSDLDTENVDPGLTNLNPKSSHDSLGTPSKKVKPNFSLNISSVLSSATLHKATTPTSPLFDKSTSAPNAFAFSTSGANSAPAGRSPKSKRMGLLGKKRSSMSPFKRVNPPSFGFSSRGGLPFSIDAALNGTLSSNKSQASGSVATPALSSTVMTTPLAVPASSASIPTLEESMPSSWFFAIHEDTPEEEAANLMEHSTGILDISSDDEATPRKKDDRGKENIPPADHVDNRNSAVDSDEALGNKRRRIDPDAMKDVGEERAPLRSLEATDFYAKGLDKSSIEIVKPEPDHEGECQQDENNQPVVIAEAAINAGTVTPTNINVVDHEEQKEAVEADVQPLNAVPEPLSTDAKTGIDSDGVPGFAIAVDQDCTAA